MLIFNILIVNSASTIANELDIQFEKGVELLNTNCPKCGKFKSLEKYLEGVTLLEDIVRNTKDVIKKNTESKLRHESLVLLAEAYTSLAISYYSSQIDKKNKYLSKTKSAYKQILKETTSFYPEIILKAYNYNKTIEGKLKALKPVLDMQSIFFKAKHEQGLLLIEQGNIKKGIEALEMAVAVATFTDAYYTSISIAQILNKYGRKDLADKIIQKAK